MIDRNQMHEDMVAFIQHLVVDNYSVDLRRDLGNAFPSADWEGIVEAIEDAAIRMEAHAEELREHFCSRVRKTLEKEFAKGIPGLDR